MMTFTLPRLCSIASTFGRVAALGCVCGSLLLGPTPRAFAALLPLSLGVKIFAVNGTAANTITSLTFINDVTLAIEAEQVGHLSNFGNFTGHFSYLAIASPATIL